MKIDCESLYIAEVLRFVQSKEYHDDVDCQLPSTSDEKAMAPVSIPDNRVSLLPRARGNEWCAEELLRMQHFITFVIRTRPKIEASHLALIEGYQSMINCGFVMAQYTGDAGYRPASRIEEIHYVKRIYKKSHGLDPWNFNGPTVFSLHNVPAESSYFWIRNRTCTQD